MKIKLLFFGIVSEIVGQENITENIFPNTDELNDHLQISYPEIKNYTYRIAVNREIINENTQLNEGDEVAFMPPFAGG